MHLTLVNFRSFDKVELDLSHDFILLSGPSGAGKTTVLMGIMFALTGEGKKIVKHGCRSCQVVLRLENLTVTRTKRPNRLEVIVDAGTPSATMYEDKLAQATIDARFKNIHLGYISQRLYKSFVLMTPTEKLDYIEHIASDKELVHQLQQKCKERVKHRRAQLAFYTHEKETRTAVLTDMNCRHHQSSSSSITISTTIEELQRQKRSLEQAITSYRINAEKKQAIDQLQHELDAMSTTVDVSVDELARQQIQSDQWRAYLKELQKLKSMKKPRGIDADDDTALTLDDIDVMINDMKTLDHLIQETKKMRRVQAELDALMADEARSAVRYTCPSCAASLGLIHDVLIRLQQQQQQDGGEGGEVKAISYQQCKENTTKKHQLLNEVTRLKALSESKETLLDAYDKNVRPRTQIQLLTALKTDLTLFQAQVQKCEAMKVNRPETSFSVEDVQQVYAKQEKQKMLDRLKTQYTPSPYQEEEEQELLRQLNEVEQAIAQFHWSKVDAAETKRKEYEITVPLAVHLQELVAKAERESVKETVEILNLYVQSYLDKFADHIQVYLVFDGARLTTEVQLHGAYDTDIHSLSGGEVARVILAFTLALAEMNHVRLLMLDESVASLDQDTTTTVIETIKQNYSGKVICIAHQTMTGIFDNVIEL